LNSVLWRRILVAIVAAIFFTFLFFAPFEQTITGQCIIEPSFSWSIKHWGKGMVAVEWDRNLTSSSYSQKYFQIDQPDVAHIDISPNISEGEYVNQGDEIATIRSENAEALLSLYTTELNREKSRKEALLAGDRPEDIEVKRQELEAARIQYELYKKEYDRVKSLFDNKLVSITDFEETKSRFKTLEADYNLAASELRAAESGAHPAKIAVQNEEIIRLEKLVHFQKSVLGNEVVIASPLSGIVGQKEESGAIITIHGMDTVAVRILIPESFAADIYKGMKVDIKLPGLNYETLPLVIDEIGFISEASALYAIGLFQNTSHRLKPGMHGSAIIPVGKMTYFTRIKNLISG